MPMVMSLGSCAQKQSALEERGAWHVSRAPMRDARNGGVGQWDPALAFRILSGQVHGLSSLEGNLGNEKKVVGREPSHQVETEKR
jgi:hypothetical protein